MRTVNKPTVLSLFSGAGGFDHGFRAAGYRILAAVEMDEDSCESLRLSGSIEAGRVICQSIHDVTTEQMLEVAGAEPGEVDVVIGGPPCQPFSKAGYWATGDARRMDDPRSATLSAYMRVVEESQPRVFVLENVAGLCYRGKDEGLRYLEERTQQINAATGSRYQISSQLLRAADYGVPQIRDRLFLVASRDGATFVFPRRTHRNLEEPAEPGEEGLPGYRTAWDALADVGPAPGEQLAATGKWAGLLPSIPEGQNYLFHTARGGGLPLFSWRGRFWNFLLKLAKNRPAWTLVAQGGPATGPFHWQSRRLAVSELKRLMTFPDEAPLAGSPLSVRRQLGNAVPSLLAEVLARDIARKLLDLPGFQGPLHLLPPDRGTPPPPDRPRPAAARYARLALEGELG